MDKGLLVLILLNTIFVSCVSLAKASDSMIVVTEDWAPYNYVQADGKIAGSSTAIVEQTLRNGDIPYTLNMYPWARSYTLALNSANVLLYSTVRTPEREKLFHWVCPIHIVEYSIFKLASRKDIVINSLDELKKYSIGITRGTFLDDFLHKNGFIKGVHLQITGDNQAIFRNLLSKRIDLIIDTQEYVDEYLAKLTLKPDYVRSIYKLNGDTDSKKELCMAISLKTPMALVEKIRSEHKKLLVKAQSE